MNPKKKILIIEDDQFLREFYQELLQSEGFQVDMAVDGATGLSIVSAGGFALILLDIMLPQKDGLQILRELKLNPPKLPNGPIVVLSNLGQGEEIRQGLALGAADYLVKADFTISEVTDKILKYLPAKK